MKYIVNNEVAGTMAIELNRFGKPTRVISLSGDGKKLGETILTYDPKGRVTERKLAWYLGKNLWGHTVDFTGPSREKIFYNTAGLVEKINTIPTGGRPRTPTYKYY